MNAPPSVIENMSQAAKNAVRRAYASPAGTTTGCGRAFLEARNAGYLVPVKGAIDRWRVTLKGREYCLRLMRAD
jgi:hypothetical protein